MRNQNNNWKSAGGSEQKINYKIFKKRRRRNKCELIIKTAIIFAFK